MAHTISYAAKILLDNFSASNVSLTDEQKSNFRSKGYSQLNGFNCRIVNVLGTNSYRILVNLDWFSGNQIDIPKPSLTRGLFRPSFDFQLIPTRSKLFAIYYLDLYTYCHELQEDRNKWFKKAYWGMVIDSDNEEFVWTGGNTRRFPLLKVYNLNDLTLRANHFKTQLKRM